MSRTLRPLSLAMGRLEFINGTFIFFILLLSNSNWKAWYTHQNKIGHSPINPCLQNKLIQNLKLKKKKNFSVHFVYFLQDHVPTHTHTHTYIYIYIFIIYNNRVNIHDYCNFIFYFYSLSTHNCYLLKSTINKTLIISSNLPIKPLCEQANRSWLSFWNQ